MPLLPRYRLALTRLLLQAVMVLALALWFSTRAAFAGPTGWAYSLPLGVVPATPVADYQVRLDLTPDTFPYANAKADGSDLRVYAGGNALPYWIETWNPVGRSTLWVKVPATGTTALTLFYGNASAAAVSSGSATFDLYDDFTSLAAWTVLNGGGIGAAQATSYDGVDVVRLTAPDTSNRVAITRPFAASPTGYIVETRANASTLGEGFLVGLSDGSISGANNDFPLNGYVFAASREGNSTDYLFSLAAGGWGTIASAAQTATTATWYTAGLGWIGTTLIAQREHATVLSATDGSLTTLGHLHLSVDSGVWNFDRVVVRKFAAVESVAMIGGGVIYTASHLAGTITAHVTTASGNAAPVSTWGGLHTGIVTPTCAFVAGNELFVTNHHAQTITVHDLDATGDTAPKRTISGNLYYPTHCWVDNGELYVANANGGNVHVYNATDNGSAVVPKRILNVQTRGLAVYGDELILPLDYNVTAGNAIYIYPKTATNPATPSRTITGSNTLLGGLVGVHASNGELFAMTGGGAVRVFNVSDDGDVAPKRSIIGPQTGLSFAVSVWATADELFVADANTNKVSVFNRNDNGDVAPKRVIVGATTGLNYPYHVMVNMIAQPVAAYEAEGNGIDSAGVHNATLFGGVGYTAGVSGKAFRFDGSTGYATVPAFDMGNNWSVEGWVRPDACSDGAHCPMLTRSAGNQDGLFIGFTGPSHSFPQQFLFNIGGSGSWQLVMPSGGRYAMGMWHYVVATRNGDTYTLFVDGEQRAQQIVPGASGVYQSRDFRIGQWNYSVGEAYLRGALDQLRIYGVALSASDVRTRYNDGLSTVSLPYREEFSGVARPAWRRTNEDANSMTLLPGKGLQITTTATDLYGATNDLKNLTTVTLPAGNADVVVTAKMTFPTTPDQNFQQAGVALLSDSNGKPDLDNYIRSMYVHEPVRRFEVVRDINSVPNGDIPNGPPVEIASGAPFWLRFMRTSGQLRTAYSTNGTIFTPFSDATVDAYNAGQSSTVRHVGVWALHSTPAASAIPVAIDHVEVASTCSALPSGLISWWAGENNANDALGLNPASAVGGVTFVPGKSGQAFNMDASTGYVQAANPEGLPINAAPRTMMLWFKTPPNFNATTEWALVQYGTPAGSQMFGLITSTNAPGRLYFYGHANDVAGATVLTPDTWYHAAVSYDGADIKIFLNGQLDGQGAVGALSTTLSTDGLTIGARPGISFWKGPIDDVAIFGRALSAAEIAAIYAGAGQGCMATKATALAISAHTPNPSVINAPVTVQVALSVVPPNTGIPTGSVAVSSGAATCMINLPANSCQITLTSSGAQSIAASYSGDAAFLPVISPAVSHTVVDVSQQSTLAVTRAGSGGGAVVSGDTLINCGSSCAQLYPNGTAISLTATADGSSNFTGWLGGCTGVGTCTLNIGTDTDVSATFAPQNMQPYTVDVDANQLYEPANDGVLVVRFLFGLRGIALTDHAVGSSPARSDAADIANYLDGIKPLLDFDGDGRVTPLTDGLILLRYLLFIRGDALIANAVGSEATRTLAADIEAAVRAVRP